LGGRVWRFHLSLCTVSFAFSHLKHFLLMTQGWDLMRDPLVTDVDKSDYSFLHFDVVGQLHFFHLISQASLVLASSCASANVIPCHICQLTLIYFPSSQPVCICAYTYVEDTWKYISLCCAKMILMFSWKMCTND